MKDKLYLSHTIKLKPNKSCMKLIEKYFGYRRYCYNRAVEVGNKWRAKYMELRHLKDIGEDITNIELSSYFPTKFNIRDFIKRTKYKYEPWEDFYTQQVNDTAIEDYTRAFAAFSKGIKNIPDTFKVKGKSTDSFRFNRKNEWSIRTKGRYLMLPTIPYKIRMCEKIRYDGKIKECTIKRKGNDIFASFVIEVKNHNKLINNNRSNYRNKIFSVGIDVGIKNMVTLGIFNDQKYKIFNDLYKDILPYINKLKIYQRLASRKVYKSKNYFKARTKCRKIHRKIVNIRNNYIHTLTKRLVTNFKYICIENYKVKEWTKDLPVKSEARIILKEQALFTFRNYLEYKCKLYGSELIIAPDDFPSTQTCSNCDHKLTGINKLSLNDRKFKCPVCGMIEDRDINAAYNLDKYIAFWLGIQPSDLSDNGSIDTFCINDGTDKLYKRCL